MGTTNTLDLNNRIDKLEKAVSGGDSAQANKSDIATEFSATTNYTAGCFVYHGGKLYQFNADHSAGAWDPTDAVEANVTDQVVSNAAAIGEVAEKLTELIPDSVTLTYYSATSLRGIPSPVPAGCSIKKTLVCPPLYQGSSLKGTVILHNETTGELMLYGDGFTSSDSVPINFYWIR